MNIPVKVIEITSIEEHYEDFIRSVYTKPEPMPDNQARQLHQAFYAGFVVMLSTAAEYMRNPELLRAVVQAYHAQCVIECDRLKKALDEEDQADS